MAGEEERLLPLCLFMSMHDLGKIVHPAQRAIHFPCKTKRSANNVPGRAASRGCTPPPPGVTTSVLSVIVFSEILYGLHALVFI